MSDKGMVLPVAVGLAIGIGFVATFATLFQPTVAFLDDEEMIKRANNTPIARAFHSAYPDEKVTIDRSSDNNYNPVVTYSSEKTYDDGRHDEIKIQIEIDRKTGLPDTGNVLPICSTSYMGTIGSRGAVSFHENVVEFLKATECAK